MVGERAAADAVRRAHRLPSLKVGLHLALVEAYPVSPPETVPDLIGPDGRFRDDMVAAGCRFFFLPRVRRQLAREIRAQFAAFAATGLALDHANAHKHFHLHPTVAGLMIRIGREYGLKALRLPVEPALPVARAEGLDAAKTGLGATAMRLWTRQLAAAARRGGMVVNDQVFGLAWSGAVTEARLLALVPYLPEGVSEIYCHPGTSLTPALAHTMPAYRHAEEFAALTSAILKTRLAEAGIRRTSFSELAAA
jgi:hopanoid biosynthesis associated protein HpnK